MSAGRSLSGAPDPMHRWSGSNGVTLAGDSWGDPDGPLVILLHGGGQTRHAWKGTGHKLGTAGYQAVAYDARGHGDSDWASDGDYSDDAQVADLLSVPSSFPGKRPALVGASMGGGVSLVAVGEGHVDATAVVLVDVAPRVEETGRDLVLQFMSQKPEGFESLEEVADAIASYQPGRARPRTLDGLTKNVRVGDDGRFHWHFDPSIVAARMDFAAREAHLEACARELKAPSLLVRGGLSEVLSEEGAAGFLDLCPQAEYVNVTGAAHMVVGDRNDIFARAVIGFLDQSGVRGKQPSSRESNDCLH